MPTSPIPSFEPNRTFSASLQRSAVPALVMKNSVELHCDFCRKALEQAAPLGKRYRHEG
jgi:hypothetical protein